MSPGLLREPPVETGEIGGPCLQHELMEPKRREAVVPQRFGPGAQRAHLQEAHIIFQIDGRIGAQVVVYALRRFGGKAEGRERAQDIRFGRAVVVEGHVQQRIQTDLQIPLDGGEAAQQDGGIRRAGCGEELRGIVVGKLFRIIGPALHVSAVKEKLPDPLTVLDGAVERRIYGLIEMAGISFMGQRGVQLDPVRGGGTVDADRVVKEVVDGRGHIKGRTGVGFQRCVHVFDGAGDAGLGKRGQGRKIRLHFLLQVGQDAGWIGEREPVGQRSGIRQAAGHFPILGHEGLQRFKVLAEGFLQDGVEAVHVQPGAGGLFDQPGIVCPALRQLAQAAGLPAVSGQQDQVVGQLLVGGKNRFGEQTVVFSQISLPLSGGEGLLSGKAVQPGSEGGLEEVCPLRQGVCVQQAVALCGRSQCVGLGHEQAGPGSGGLIVGKTLQVSGNGFQEGKIMRDVLPGAQRVLRQQEGQLALHAGGGGKRFLIQGKACALQIGIQIGDQKVPGVAFLLCEMTGADPGEPFQHIPDGVRGSLRAVRIVDLQGIGFGRYAESLRPGQGEVKA